MDTHGLQDQFYSLSDMTLCQCIHKDPRQGPCLEIVLAVQCNARQPLNF